MPSEKSTPASVIYQRGKIDDIPAVLADFDFAKQLIAGPQPIGRLYAGAGGALVAVAHALQLHSGAPVLDEFAGFLRQRGFRGLRRPNWLGVQYGFFNLNPLRRWLSGRLRHYLGSDDRFIGTLPVQVFLLTQDRDGYPVFLGPPQPHLHAVFHNCETRVEDVRILDGVIASLSHIRAFPPVRFYGRYYKGSRPTYTELRALVLDMESDDPRPLIAGRPSAPLPAWPSNAVTQPFIMHRWHERNHIDASVYYVDLVQKARAVERAICTLEDGLHRAGVALPAQPDTPAIRHVRLPYIGSTEASENMRQIVARKQSLMQTHRALSAPQFAQVDFSRPLSLVYGAGGFSGIVAGQVVAQSIAQQGGEIREIFACSAGVLNGLFHSVALAAQRGSSHYTALACNALQDLDNFIDRLAPERLMAWNTTPGATGRALANYGPMRDLLADLLQRWTGRDGYTVTFADIALPFYLFAARGSDGYGDFLGLPNKPGMTFAGRQMAPVNCPIVDAMAAAMAQPFYITPPVIEGETYFDGGAAFYDVELFAVGMSDNLPNLVSVHLSAPPNDSYGFDARPSLRRIVFDTHNFYMPEMRRRMSKLIDRFYDLEAQRRWLHALRDAAAAQAPALLDRSTLPELPDGWWRHWQPDID